MNSGGMFGDTGATEDLGPRGRTQLRLILTPREPAPVHPAAPVALTAPVLSVTAERRAPTTVARSIVDILRRDTLVASLLGSPAFGVVFINFNEYFPISMTSSDDLRDEERAGGFDDDEQNETFLRDAAPTIPAAAATSSPMAAPSQQYSTVSITPSRFPMKTLLIGLPAVMMFIAFIVLYSWRHDPTKSTAREIQLTPSVSSSPTTTAADVARNSPPSVQPPTVAAPNPPAVSMSGSSSAAIASNNTKASVPAIVPGATPKSSVAESATPVAVPVPTTTAHGNYEIQVVATPSRAEADRRASALSTHGAHAFIREVDHDGLTMYRVRVGGYASEAAARADGARLGLRSMWIERTGR